MNVSGPILSTPMQKVQDHRSSAQARIGELGRRVEELRSTSHRNENDFPEIAHRALEELDLARTLDVDEIVAWVGQTSRLPSQLDLNASFGNPPLTVYRSEDGFFLIDLYFHNIYHFLLGLHMEIQ